MPTVTFDPSVNSSPASLLAMFDQLGGGTVIGASSTEIRVQFGSTVISVTGTGFDYSGNLPVAGTVTGIHSTTGSVTQIDISGLSLSLPLVYQTIHEDYTGLNPTGIEDMFLPLGWNYTGNDNADLLPKGAMTTDGVLLNLSGKDVFTLNGGADNVFLGDGNDKAYGGTGKDTLDGGLGADSLFGGAGADRLIGGGGADKLRGNADADVLTGGAGTDTFIFALHDGSDRITDMAVLQDRIDLPSAVGHSFTTTLAGTVLHYGSFGDQVLLAGIDLTHAQMITFI